jgi:hypothetical protein
VLLLVASFVALLICCWRRRRGGRGRWHARHATHRPLAAPRRPLRGARRRPFSRAKPVLHAARADTFSEFQVRPLYACCRPRLFHLMSSAAVGDAGCSEAFQAQTPPRRPRCSRGPNGCAGAAGPQWHRASAAAAGQHVIAGRQPALIRGQLRVGSGR